MTLRKQSKRSIGFLSEKSWKTLQYGTVQVQLQGTLT